MWPASWDHSLYTCLGSSASAGRQSEGHLIRCSANTLVKNGGLLEFGPCVLIDKCMQFSISFRAGQQKSCLKQKPLYICIVIESSAKSQDHTPSRIRVYPISHQDHLFIKWPWPECISLHLMVTAILTCPIGQNQKGNQRGFAIKYINITYIWIAQKLLNK